MRFRAAIIERVRLPADKHVVRGSVLAVVAGLVFLYRGWHGQLPRSVSERGAEWEALATAEDGIQEQIDELSARVDEVKRMLSGLGGSTSTITP